MASSGDWSGVRFPSGIQMADGRWTGTANLRRKERKGIDLQDRASPLPERNDLPHQTSLRPSASLVVVRQPLVLDRPTLLK